MKKKGKLIPPYAVVPLLLILVTNFFAYYVSKLIILGRDKWDPMIPLDDLIPLWTPFILIYLVAYVQWVVGYIIIARQGKEICYKVAGANVIAKLLCFLIFIIIPTTISARPEIEGTGLFDLATRFIHWFDSPVNLFPSVHCLESYAIMRFTVNQKKLPFSYKIFTVVLSLLVFASVVFTKQHRLLDIPSGILVLEIGFLISHLSGFPKIFKRFENGLFPKKTGSECAQATEISVSDAECACSDQTVSDIDSAINAINQETSITEPADSEKTDT